MASTVTQTTVSATTTHVEASVEITPADADAADGHQVDLSAGQNAVTIVVTADNDSTTEDLHGQRQPRRCRRLRLEGRRRLRHADRGRRLDSVTGIWSDGTTMWVADAS